MLAWMLSGTSAGGLEGFENAESDGECCFFDPALLWSPFSLPVVAVHLTLSGWSYIRRLRLLTTRRVCIRVIANAAHEWALKLLACVPLAFPFGFPFLVTWHTNTYTFGLSTYSPLCPALPLYDSLLVPSVDLFFFMIRFYFFFKSKVIFWTASETCGGNLQTLKGGGGDELSGIKSMSPSHCFSKEECRTRKRPLFLCRACRDWLIDD